MLMRTFRTAPVLVMHGALNNFIASSPGGENQRSAVSYQGNVNFLGLSPAWRGSSPVFCSFRRQSKRPNKSNARGDNVVK